MKKRAIFSLVLLLSFLLPGFIKAENVSITDDTKELFKNIQIFSDALTLINAEYIKPVKITDLISGAIKGMMGTLDKYSKFLDSGQYQEITEETKGEFGGIGVEVGIRQDVLTVLKVMEGTPAERVGIKKRDRIVKITDKSTQDWSLDESVDLMRGDPGTSLNITVYREKTEEVLDFKIKRGIIKLKSIKDVKILDKDIGYLRLVEFQERTARDIKKVIKDFQQKGLDKIILDLRGNPGGLLDASVEVADLFLEPGKLIVYTKGRDSDSKIDFISKKTPVFSYMKIIILINKGSASAAEILAGALKDNKKAVLVGTATFGKGSVQTVIPLQDGAGLRLTTAAYFTPSGKNLMDKGIEPDVTVKKHKVVRKKTSENKSLGDEIFRKVEKLTSPEDVSFEEETDAEKNSVIYDNQLQAAIDILKGAEIFCANKTERENRVRSSYTTQQVR